MNGSPWRLALGARIDDLDPALRDYVEAIPEGRVGRGAGTFDTVGTPRRWVWPLFAVLGRWGILFPVWERDVPFEIVNTPVTGGLRAERVFHLRAGRRTMRDEVRMTPGGLVDVLGDRGRLEVALTARAVEGGLELRSRGTRVRLGRLRLPVPFAPQLHLREFRRDGRQRVELELRMPLLGRVYEYAGSFDYRIEAA